MTRPDVRELECFAAVADHLNFSRAARQLNLSQPPLTRHIQALEEKLGSKLFERNTHSVALTEAGRLFLDDARTILRHLDRAAATFRRARQGETERLRLAFVGSLLSEQLVRLVRQFRTRRPLCQVEMSDLSPAAQLAALQGGELDGGFIGAYPARPVKGVAFFVWHQEPLVLVLPEDHPLAQAPALRWPQLRGLSWVMVSRQAAPAFRQQFVTLAARHALAPQIVQESDRVSAVLTMVAAGGGVTVVPQAMNHLLARGVVYRPLPSPPPQMQHTFAWRSEPGHGALENFLSLVRESAAAA